jgi:predicted nucleic acid-binding protein
VDALIVAMAERLNIIRLLTLDRRDFQIIRPKHCGSFELLP